MNNLLFYLLLALLLWYFFYYLPSQKKDLHPDHFTPNSSPHPLRPKSPETTQSEPNPTRAEFPSNQTETTLSLEDQTDLENTLDQMIKSMHEFSQELDKY
jgi:hypothetical protein